MENSIPKTNILWFTWKDSLHPQSGGAETVNEEIARRLVRRGYNVIFIVQHFPDATHEDKRNGFNIFRVGSKYTLYREAKKYYKNNLPTWPHLVIDEVNTIPFFAARFTAQPTILFFHQLAREVWFHQMPFPLSLVGYVLEPLYLKFLPKTPAVTISKSTKDDLAKHGFPHENTTVIPQGITMQPIEHPDSLKKANQPTLLSLGAIRSMKQTHQIVQAYELAKKHIPNLQLHVAGSPTGRYGKRVLRAMENSPHTKDITYHGRVSEEKRKQLMQEADILAVTSVKEGWGLVVTEAASQGTPSVVYNNDGLRDSVRHLKTGMICKENTPQCLARDITQLINDPILYKQLQHNAWQWSRELTFDNATDEFEKVLEENANPKRPTS